MLQSIPQSQVSGSGSGHCYLRHKEKTMQDNHPIYKHLREDKPLKAGTNDTPTTGTVLEVIMKHILFER